VNPDSKKNMIWRNRFMDMIGRQDRQVTSARVIEVETESSVRQSEANSQWYLAIAV